MKILGYSERGVLNSFFYEIKCAPNGLELINEFFTMISFPYNHFNFRVEKITTLIEQSFSDFGDADLVLLIDNDGKRQTVFVEAKVKTNRPKSWFIDDEYDRFKSGIEKNEVSSSNLFTQLYHKIRLFNALKECAITTLQAGIAFPKCSSKKLRKIGNNQVVLDAAKKIKDFSEDAFYVAIIPGESENIEKFFRDTLTDFKPPGFKEWDVKNWGYICWENVENFCKKNNLTATLDVFKHNKGQIY